MFSRSYACEKQYNDNIAKYSSTSNSNLMLVMHEVIAHDSK